MIPVCCRASKCSSTSLAELSAVEWAELQGDLKSWSVYVSGPAGGVVCDVGTCARHLASCPSWWCCTIITSNKSPKTTRQQHPEPLVAPDRHQFQYELEARMVNHAAHIQA